jgi:hypothetical protein
MNLMLDSQSRGDLLKDAVVLGVGLLATHLVTNFLGFNYFGLPKEVALVSTTVVVNYVRKLFNIF